MIITCCYCKKEVDLPTGAVNYRRKVYGLDVNLYCNRTCAGFGRRANKSIEEKKAEKAAYDQRYRKRDYVKVNRAKSFQRNYDPVKAAEKRKLIMPRHVEYCRRPEYRAYKQQYDQEHRAKKHYGEFWESALLINEIQAQYDDKEVRQINNLHNKSQKRKRAWRPTK